MTCCAKCGAEICPNCAVVQVDGTCSNCGDCVECVCMLDHDDKCEDCANTVQCVDCGCEFQDYELTTYGECEDCEQLNTED